MQILILGAGQVGGILADSLAKERFDVTLVDKDASRLKEMGERLDIKQYTARPLIQTYYGELVPKKLIF